MDHVCFILHIVNSHLLIIGYLQWQKMKLAIHLGIKIQTGIVCFRPWKTKHFFPLHHSSFFNVEGDSCTYLSTFYKNYRKDIREFSQWPTSYELQRIYCQMQISKGSLQYFVRQTFVFRPTTKLCQTSDFGAYVISLYSLQ